jgi:uncharacterized Zn-binding protein involved in type VI secretion
MAKSIQRVGDRNTAGGVITKGDDSVLINGRAVAIRGVSVSAHPCCGWKGCPPTHCNAKTQTKNSTVLVNGVPLILTDDKDTCDHPRAGGSADVLVG